MPPASKSSSMIEGTSSTSLAHLKTIYNEPRIPSIGRFWEEFVRDPPKVVSMPVTSYTRQTEILEKVCLQICNDFLSEEPTTTTTTTARRIEHMTDEYGLESPLSPSPQFSTSLVEAVVVNGNSIGETFSSKNLYTICRCERDDPEKCSRTNKSAMDDWLVGHCGLRATRCRPNSFVHVNLNRKINSLKKFCETLYRRFFDSQIDFRPVLGDSGNSIVLLASDKEHESKIRKLLRQDEIRLELGLRIFRVSQDIAATKDKFAK